MKRTIFALALALALPVSAQAGEINYNFIQAGYASTSFDGGDFNGWNLNGSVGFADNFYAFAGYSTGDESSIDLNQTNLGLGWHSTGEAQWYAEVSWIKNEIDFGGGFSFDDSGYTVAGGVRGYLGDNFEGGIELNYSDVGDFGDGIGVGLNGTYHFNETWGAYASYDYSDRNNFDLDTWGLGVRASF